MTFNSDINILGGLPDFNLILHFLERDETHASVNEPYHTYTAIKTDKSVKRFAKAITGTFLKYRNADCRQILQTVLKTEEISLDSLLLLYWNASYNNELLHYFNSQVYFPAFYSGRLVIKNEEVSACLKDLKETEIQIKNWTIETINTVARKYLTLLKKFHLMEGSLTKTIIHPYLNDKTFILFVYWIKSIEDKVNLLESEWLQYSFSERSVFIERVLQKKFSKYFQLQYTGDKLSIETLIPYENIYHAIK